MRIAAAIRLWLFACVPAAAVAWAAPVVIGPGGFSGAETVIGFSGLVPGESITIQYLAQGVTFATPGLAAALDPDSLAPVAASELGVNPVVVYFNSPMLRAGFDVRALSPSGGGGGAILLTLTALDASLSPAGDVSFLPGAGFYEFAGLETGAGIHGLWISSPDPFLLANLRFEGAAPVPETGSSWLLLAGLVMLPLARRRKKRQLCGAIPGAPGLGARGSA